MPWTFHDELSNRALPQPRPREVTAVSPDGNYAVRVAVDPRGNAEEALRHAQQQAQRVLEEQYPPHRYEAQRMDVTTFGSAARMTIPGIGYEELTVEQHYRLQEMMQFRGIRADWPDRPPPPQDTEEQRLVQQRWEAERAAQREEDERRRRERDERYRAANTKGFETLKRMLSHEQLREFDLRGAFHVEGSEGNTYEIDTTCGYSGNVNWVDKESGNRMANFCCHPNMYGQDLEGIEDRLPPSDAYIAQKLSLEADELTFLRTTVLNEGVYPSAVREQHTDELQRYQRCRCKKCYGGYGGVVYDF